MVILGTIILLFGLWQLNLMTAGYATSVWNTLFSINVWLFPDMTFGYAYDLCHIMIVLGFIISILGLWFWED